MRTFLEYTITTFVISITAIFGLECLHNVPLHLEQIHYWDDIKVAGQIALVIGVIFGTGDLIKLIKNRVLKLNF